MTQNSSFESPSPDARSTTVLVTGASSGIGAERYRPQA